MNTQSIDGIQYNKPRSMKLKMLQYLQQYKSISHLEADGAYSYVVLNNGNKVLYSYTLKALSCFLPDQTFIRIHRKYFINCLNIQSIHKGSNSVHMNDGKILPVSRSQKYQLLNKLKTVSCIK